MKASLEYLRQLVEKNKLLEKQNIELTAERDRQKVAIAKLENDAAKAEEATRTTLSEVLVKRSKRPASNSPAPPLAIAPFDEAVAKRHQRAWADYLGVPVEVTDAFGNTFMLIPPGEFLMGSDGGGDKP